MEVLLKIIGCVLITFASNVNYVDFSIMFILILLIDHIINYYDLVD